MWTGHTRDQLGFAFLSRRIGQPNRMMLTLLHVAGGGMWATAAEDGGLLPTNLVLRCPDLHLWHVSGHVWLKTCLQHGVSLGAGIIDEVGGSPFLGSQSQYIFCVQEGHAAANIDK